MFGAVVAADGCRYIDLFNLTLKDIFLIIEILHVKNENDNRAYAHEQSKNRDK